MIFSLGFLVLYKDFSATGWTNGQKVSNWDQQSLCEGLQPARCFHNEKPLVGFYTKLLHSNGWRVKR
jgi:hypothetical protein